VSHDAGPTTGAPHATPSAEHTPADEAALVAIEAATETTDADPVEEPFPTFSQQVAAQLGGARGMVESSIPVVAFVLVNVLWQLRPALIVAVATALAIATFRLTRRQSVRHAINGLFGIGLGALIAWRTGSPKDFYLPGIYMSLGYGIAMVLSVAGRRPLVGWIWAVIADGGSSRWHDERGLRRIFGWLTLLWAAIYLAKAALQVGIFYADALTEDQKTGILGAIRIVLGFPPYALLLAVTIWAVRRHTRLNPPAEPAPA
jgi:hypothetical protein